MAALSYNQDEVMKEFFAGTDNVESIAVKPGAVDKGDWDEKYLELVVEANKLPAGLRSLEVTHSCYINFYAYYFHGILPPKCSAHHVIFPILATLHQQTPTQEYQAIFPDHMFANQSFFALPQVNIRISDLEKKSTYEAAPYTSPFSDVEALEEIRDLYYQTTSEDTQTFLKNVIRLLKQWDTYAAIDNEIASFMSLTGFLALTLFRAITKDSAQLARGMHKNQYRKNVFNLCEWPQDFGYAPPCKLCIEGCTTNLEKGNRHSSIMFALILDWWNKWRTADDLDKYFNARLQAALLTHTAGNGLGIILMMKVTCDSLGTDWKTLAMYTYTMRTQASWNLIKDFLIKYHTKSRVNHTYYWARIIHDGFFMSLATKNHVYLAGIFGGVISLTQTLGSIKEAAWYKSQPLLAQSGMDLGRKLAQRFTLAPDTGLSAAARSLLEDKEVYESRHSETTGTTEKSKGGFGDDDLDDDE